MKHYTCDLCGQALPGQRYIVTIEIQPASDSEGLSEQDLDVDHLHEISELLEQEYLDGDAEEPDRFSATHQEYDLCDDCRRKFARDPLGHGMRRRIKFSGN